MATQEPSTDEHSQRVQLYAVALAEEIGISDQELLDAISVGARLHDVGKLSIPEPLLQKRGPLTREEYEQVKQHAAIGADMLAAMDVPAMLQRIVRHHHENWDGSGYPDCLRCTAIPIGARVLSIADRYDALTSDRPYRRALSAHSAAAMLHEGRGTLYDPAMTDAFLRIRSRIRSASFGVPATQRTRVRLNVRWREARAV